MSYRKDIGIPDCDVLRSTDEAAAVGIDYVQFGNSRKEITPVSSKCIQDRPTMSYGGSSRGTGMLKSRDTFESSRLYQEVVLSFTSTF